MDKEGTPISHIYREAYSRQVDIFAKDLILIPINVGGMHWIAAAINMRKKRIEYFDSMGSYGTAMQDVSEVSLSSPLHHRIDD